MYQDKRGTFLPLFSFKFLDRTVIHELKSVLSSRNLSQVNLTQDFIMFFN